MKDTEFPSCSAGGMVGTATFHPFPVEKVVLGQKYRDCISGFEGIAVARTERLHASPWVALEAETTKDGKPAGEVWLYEGRLEIVTSRKIGFDAVYDNVKNVKTPEGHVAIHCPICGTLKFFMEKHYAERQGIGDCDFEPCRECKDKSLVVKCQTCGDVKYESNSILCFECMRAQETSRKLEIEEGEGL